MYAYVRYRVGDADAVDDPRSLIRTGNERVLKARLEDARFFWEQDRKVPLADRAAGLRAVLFQEKLGSYEDKTQRLRRTHATWLAVAAGKVAAQESLGHESLRTTERSYLDQRYLRPLNAAGKLPRPQI